jgi:hypothetical protein
MIHTRNRMGKIHYLRSDKIFLDMIPKLTNEKADKLDFIKI